MILFDILSWHLTKSLVWLFTCDLQITILNCFPAFEHTKANTLGTFYAQAWQLRGRLFSIIHGAEPQRLSGNFKLNGRRCSPCVYLSLLVVGDQIYFVIMRPTNFPLGRDNESRFVFPHDDVPHRCRIYEENPSVSCEGNFATLYDVIRW